MAEIQTLTMVRKLTVAELAEDAFLKTERVKMLEMLNTPQGFDDRKKAFIELAEARAFAAEATRALRGSTETI